MKPDEYELVICYNGLCFRGVVDLKQKNQLAMEPLNITFDEYFTETKDHAIMLDKSFVVYDSLQEFPKSSMMSEE